MLLQRGVAAGLSLLEIASLRCREEEEVAASRRAALLALGKLEIDRPVLVALVKCFVESAGRTVEDLVEISYAATSESMQIRNKGNFEEADVR